MQSTIYIILIIVFVATFIYFASPDTDKRSLLPASVVPVPDSEDSAQSADSQVEPDVILQEPVTKQVRAAPSTPSPTLIDTLITDGPKEDQIIEDTNKVTFEFEAQIYSSEISQYVYFETRMPGFDDRWISTAYQTHTVTLEPGTNEYTFEVRAKSGQYVDPTPAKRTFKISVSPYFEKVIISQVKPETSAQPSLITLNSQLSPNEQINITGWSLEGWDGKVTIPQGVEQYFHFYKSNVNEDIVLQWGERVLLSSAYNPLGRDRNFRTNQCLGFLTNTFDFPIPIPLNCPRPESNDISHLDPCCQQFINALRSCQIPDFSDEAVLSLGSECLSYLKENLNNIACFANYFQNTDFLGNEWHIYLNNKNIVASYNCDTLYLYDKNGLLVDEYSYGQSVCRR